LRHVGWSGLRRSCAYLSHPWWLQGGGSFGVAYDFVGGIAFGGFGRADACRQRVGVAKGSAESVIAVVINIRGGWEETVAARGRRGQSAGARVQVSG
jgi:hypothetical protein